MTGTLGQPLRMGNRVAIPDGRVVKFDGVDICPVSDGKITAKISYVDATAWYDQLTFE
jgi:ketosteroid isomerase-like protein